MMKRKKIERENRRINRVTVTCVVIGVVISLIQFLKPESKPQVVIHKHYHYYQTPLPTPSYNRLNSTEKYIRSKDRAARGKN